MTYDLRFGNRPNPLIQIAILFGIMVLSLFLCSYLVLFLLSPLFGVSNPTAFISSIELQKENIDASIFAQSLISAIGTFLIPALVFCQVLRYPFGNFFKVSKLPSFLQLVLAGIIIVCGGIFINLIVEITQQISLPESLAFLRNGQEKSNELINAFLSVETFQHFLVLAFSLAFLPALAEEFFFRGVLQNLFRQMGLTPIIAMVLAGLAFSVMHLAFDNFLAIWLMGFVLGWLYYYTQSLWINIFAHFVNNLSVILLKYAYISGVLKTDWTAEETSVAWYISLVTAVLMAIGMWLLKKLRTAADTETN